jgi:hypothetical protein
VRALPLTTVQFALADAEDELVAADATGYVPAAVHEGTVIISVEEEVCPGESDKLGFVYTAFQPVGWDEVMLKALDPQEAESLFLTDTEYETLLPGVALGSAGVMLMVGFARVQTAPL